MIKCVRHSHFEFDACCCNSVETGSLAGKKSKRISTALQYVRISESSEGHDSRSKAAGKMLS